MTHRLAPSLLLVVAALGCSGHPSATPRAPVHATPPPSDPALVTPTPVTPPTIAAPTPPPPPPPPRELAIAWQTANAGKQTLQGHAVAVRGDGTVVVVGQGDAEGWSPTRRKVGRLMPNFVASLATTGKGEWVRTIDTHNGSASAVAATPDGAVIVAGSFEKTLTIEGKTIVKAKGRYDLFVARFERDGTHAWTVTAAGDDLAMVEGVAVQPDGTSFIVGSIEGTVKFGELTATSAGERDAFLARVSPKGAFDFVTTAGSAGSDEARGVVVRADAVYVVGYYGGDATFQDRTLALPKPMPDKVANPSNIFVASYGLSGDVRWVERIGTHTSFDRGWAIAAVRDGVVITGDFEERAVIARYTADGKRRWLRRVTGHAQGRGVIAIADDEVITALVVGGITGHEDVVLAGDRARLVVHPRGGMDTALVRWSADGEPLSVAQLAGETPSKRDERTGAEMDVGALAVSATGRIAAVGRLWGNAVVEPGGLLKTGPRLVTTREMNLALVVLDPVPVPVPVPVPAR